MFIIEYMLLVIYLYCIDWYLFIGIVGYWL